LRDTNRSWPDVIFFGSQVVHVTSDYRHNDDL